MSTCQLCPNLLPSFVTVPLTPLQQKMQNLNVNIERTKKSEEMSVDDDEKRNIYARGSFTNSCSFNNNGGSSNTDNNNSNNNYGKVDTNATDNNDSSINGNDSTSVSNGTSVSSTITNTITNASTITNSNTNNVTNSNTNTSTITNSIANSNVNTSNDNTTTFTTTTLNTATVTNTALADETILARPFYPNNSQFAFEDPIEDKQYPIPKNRPVRIYCDGVYDLFHYGHMRSLMQAKHLFPNVYLLVGVTNDCTTLQNKGSIVFNEHERTESVRHCRYVDEVIQDAPWSITDAFIEAHRIDYVCHDNVPYSCAHTADVYDSLKRANKFIPTRRTLGISTTNIITKIVKDYDLFVRRQLERGINADELNLSFFKKESIYVKNTIKNIETDLMNEIREIRDELRIALLYWERVSNEMVSTFSHRFVRTVNEHSLFKRIFRKIVLMIERKRGRQ